MTSRDRFIWFSLRTIDGKQMQVAYREYRSPASSLEGRMLSTEVKCSHCGRTVRRDAVVYGNHDRKYCGIDCADRQVDQDIGVGHHSVQQSNSGRDSGDGGAARDRSESATSADLNR